MTPSELKYHVSRGENSRYFDRANLKYFGDRMSNYGVRSATIETWSDKEHYVEVWELYRKRPVKNGLIDSAYFRKDTFARVYVKKYD